MTPELLDRLKKLLRLAESPNPHEAAIALSRARELAERHQIDIATVAFDDPACERVVHQWFHVGGRWPLDVQLVLQVIQRHFHVELCRGGDRILFVGTPTAIVLADHAKVFLLGSLRRALKRWADAYPVMHRRRPTSLKRRQFTQGWIYGVSESLREVAHIPELEMEKFALILADQKRQRKAHLDEVIPNQCDVELPKVKPAKDKSALVSGYLAGKRTTINPAIAAAPSAQPLLS